MKKRHAILLLASVLFAACGDGARSVTVIGPDGEEIRGAILVAIRPGAKKHDGWFKTYGKDGPAMVPREAVYVDSRLIVYAPGCRLVDREMPGDDVRIHLEKGIPVRVHLEEGCILPDPNLTLKVEFELVERPAGLGGDFAFGIAQCVTPENFHDLDFMDRRKGSGRFLPSQRTVTLLFPHPGTWEPRVTIMRYETEVKGSLRTESGSGSGLRDGSVPSVVVLDQANIQEVTLFPERHEYQRVLERVRAGN